MRSRRDWRGMDSRLRGNDEVQAVDMAFAATVL